MLFAWNLINGTNRLDNLKIIGHEKYGYLKREQSKNRKGMFAKIVYQLHKDTGKIIKKWNSVTEATEHFNTPGIAMCATGVQKSACGFCWAYEDGLEQTINDIRNGIKKGIITCSKIVYQIDKDTGKIIKEWSSIAEAIRGVKGKSKGIYDAANTRFATAVGFCWSYEDQLDQTITDIMDNVYIHPNSKRMLENDTTNTL